MPHKTVNVIALVLVSACSAVDVGPELTLLNEATVATGNRVTTLASDDPEGERQAHLANAVAANPSEPWTFPDGCEAVPQADDDPGTCKLDRGAAWKAPVLADSIRRKMSVIASYVDALSSMANATDDATLLAAYSAAVASIGGLADAADVAALQETVKALKDQEKAIGNVATFLLAQRRAQLLRRTVMRSQADFDQVVQEIIEALMNKTNEDESLGDQKVSLQTILAEARDARARQDVPAYQDALDRSDRLYGQFMDARGRSIFASLAGLAATHRALRSRLQRPATLQEIQVFTQALADLRQSLQ